MMLKYLCLAFFLLSSGCIFDEEYSNCLSLSNETFGCNPSPKDACVEELAISRGDASLCNKLTEGDCYYPNIGACVQKVAMATGNPKECDRLGLVGSYKAIVCYSKYAIDTENITVCDLAPFTINADKCKVFFILYNHFPSPSKKDWSLCDEVTLAPIRDECYEMAGEDTLNVSYCDKIRAAEYYTPRRSCYTFLAKSLGDRTVCENLVTEDEKEYCHKKVPSE